MSPASLMGVVGALYSSAQQLKPPCLRPACRYCYIMVMTKVGEGLALLWQSVVNNQQDKLRGW